MNAKLLSAILFVMVILAAGVSSHAADAAPFAATAQSVINATAAAEVVEFEAVVTMVQEKTVVLDKGLDDGIATGTILPLYDIAPADAAGAESAAPVKVGDISIVQAVEHISFGIVEKSDKAPAKGMVARYLVSKAALKAWIKPATGVCPDDMQQVDAGEFAWAPGALTNQDASFGKGGSDSTGYFCVDIAAYKKKLSWSDAALYCAAQGKRLCSISEQRKVCLKHSKKPPCAKKAPGDICPRGAAVEDFVGILEWAESWQEIDPLNPDSKITRTGSCTCGGGNAACTACYYPYCQGALKKFRCCLDLE